MKIELKNSKICLKINCNNTNIRTMDKKMAKSEKTPDKEFFSSPVSHSPFLGPFFTLLPRKFSYSAINTDFKKQEGFDKFLFLANILVVIVKITNTCSTSLL